MSSDPKVLGYAKAIFEIARTEGELERVSDELFHIARTFESEHRLTQSLTDIYLPSEAKESLIDELLGSKASPHTVGVVKFLVGQGRARNFAEIADSLARMAEQESRREIAEVRTAVPLDEGQRQRLAAAIGNATGKDVTVKVVVDRNVIGGVIARVGDTVIDGTVRQKLESLKDHLGVG